MKNSAGVSTLEILVSLSIAIPILFTLTVSLHQGVDALNLASKQHRYILNVARISNLFQSVLDDLDSHTFPIEPQIHHNGLITFSDGSPSPIMLSAHGPVTSSDAITGLKLALDGSLSVRSNKLIGASVQLLACPRFKSNPNVELSCLLGIHSLGFIELKIESVSKPNKEGCRTFVAQFGKSMSVPSADSLSAQAVSMLIPIERHYTLYIDRDSQLRYVGHCAESILENQPVLSKIDMLKLWLDNLSQLPASLLKARVTLQDNQPINLAGTNNLARTGIFTFLLNRP
jgi:hypothetical protein